MDTADGRWRVYTHVTDEGTVQVGQPVAARDALARELSLSVLMPMLLLIPLLGVVVAWALTRGLQPLHDASRRVSDRDASRLDPLPTDNVPRELLPLVQQINALLARLEGAFDAQRRFLADAAHELRSPVAALALQVQLAERAQSPAARAGALHELARGVERARRLVQQLMDFARLDAAVPLQAFAAVNLAALVARGGRPAMRCAPRARTWTSASTRPASVQAFGAEAGAALAHREPGRQRAALCAAGSPVTVAVRAGRAMVELRVVDAGRGIPASERERVFERFHRVAGDATRGTGLASRSSRRSSSAITAASRFQTPSAGAALPGLAVSIRLPAWRGHARPAESLPAERAGTARSGLS